MFCTWGSKCFVGCRTYILCSAVIRNSLVSAHFLSSSGHACFFFSTWLRKELSLWEWTVVCLISHLYRVYQKISCGSVRCIIRWQCCSGFWLLIETRGQSRNCESTVQTKQRIFNIEVNVEHLLRSYKKERPSSRDRMPKCCLRFLTWIKECRQALCLNIWDVPCFTIFCSNRKDERFVL